MGALTALQASGR